MNPILHDLQNKQWLWSGAQAKQSTSQVKLQTGYENLDSVLSGGFPQAGMLHIESALGCGEMRLMLSILQKAGGAANNKASSPSDFTHTKRKLYVFINPPYELNAEFLLSQNIDLSQLVLINANKTQTDALWSAEQCLKSGACYAVFVWQSQLKHSQIRKLELAAQQGASYCIWLDAINSHQQAAPKHNLPLSLSLSISRENEILCVKINKQKRGWAQKSVKVPLPFSTKTNVALKNRLHQGLANKNVVSIHANSHTFVR